MKLRHLHGDDPQMSQLIFVSLVPNHRFAGFP